jgi:mono/diheme cytochrome c family protein
VCLLPAGALADDPTPESGFTMPPADDSWVLIPDLGADATQVDYGAEVYRLVCKACHGDRGQGLTPDWIAQWAPEDQNCWQSKCHAVNHPPEGFDLPRDIPPVTGAQIAAKYPDAQRLHGYIAATMPWHNPGALSPDEYWQVTAYIAAINGVNPEGVALGSENAAAYRLAPAPQQTAAMGLMRTPQPPGTAATRQAEITASQAVEQEAREGWPWGWALLLLFSMAGMAWVADRWMRQL